jgi:hypothetical protein
MELSRLIFLLEKASKEFENLSSPFNTEWLSKHNVTLDECGDLSEAISLAIDYFLLVVLKRANKSLNQTRKLAG